MKVVVLANLRWLCHSPSLYQLMCPADHSIHLGFSGEVWYLAGKVAGEDVVVTVPDRDTGAMMLAKQLDKAAAEGNGA